jgi:acetyltransferase
MWLEMFQSLSEESIRYRFFQMLKDTPHEVRVRYCNVDYDREIALVAEMDENGKRKILGVSRLTLESDEKSGEMAFLVSDYWQGLGLGTKMVDYTLDIAKEKGIEKVDAIILQDNYRALSLTKKMGFNIEYLTDGTVKATLNLKDEDIDFRCINLPEPPKATQEEQPQAIPVSNSKKAIKEAKEATPA